ncbi:MAG: hypothetical protein PHX18_06835 [Candidatus Gastranaerophilales bacterium]|nr:hypothetical protein [Candidatus Gastranaerophilales bacterium]
MNNFRLQVIALVLVILTAVLYFSGNLPETFPFKKKIEITEMMDSVLHPLEEITNGKEQPEEDFAIDDNAYNIEIKELSEYDGKTKAEIYEIRKEAVKNLPFEIKDYTPDEKVFGRIQDNLPWWGMQGIMCRGSGPYSDMGMSEESRFINNPLLLIAIDTNYAYSINGWICDDIYPKPFDLKVNSDKNIFSVKYNLTDFIKATAHTDWQRDKNRFKYSFDAKNARDFGYNYGYIYSYKNIGFAVKPNASNVIYQFRDFIHRGRSCDQPDGCNNGSPEQFELTFEFVDLPAHAYFKLYKKLPEHKKDKPDAVYKIDFV